ncbi:Uncharacterised protein [Amycolatopsis camponoti]|uniref:Uncharacterized protein n=1 Tax=Amycolatopsis camponoti TaxID=2606593 RepID=A0A6I8LZH8_9PSEU|nr:hypothetical protein [Amycolatopsis camponoti]VVJ22725.1 Uncharacterised protein [Amycolatopsis camponoti]
MIEPSRVSGLSAAAETDWAVVAAEAAPGGDERGHSTVPFGPCLFGRALVMVLAGD